MKSILRYQVIVNQKNIFHLIYPLNIVKPQKKNKISYIIIFFVLSFFFFDTISTINNNNLYKLYGNLNILLSFGFFGLFSTTILLYNNEDFKKNFLSQNLLQSKKLTNELEGKPPVVLADSIDETGKSNPNFRYPRKIKETIHERVLPYLGQVYPFITSDDFLDDHMLQLDFPINKDRFISGKIVRFSPDEKSYLLPLKKTFFDFFDTSDVQDRER